MKAQSLSNLVAFYNGAAAPMDTNCRGQNLDFCQAFDMVLHNLVATELDR